MRRRAWVAFVLACGAWAEGCLLLERSSVDAISGGTRQSDASSPGDGARADVVVPSNDAGSDVSPATSYRQAVMNDMPLAYWRLNEEADASIAHDETGNGYDGHYIGPVTLGVAGAMKGDMAASFSAQGYVTMNSTMNLALAGTPFTIELWIQQTMTGTEPFLSRGDYMNLSGGYTLFTDLMDAGGVTMTVEFWHPAPGTIQLSVDEIAPNQWVYFVLTFDGATDGGPGPALIYVNNSAVTEPQPLPALQPLANTAFTLSTPDGDGNHGKNFFVGLLDEVAVYDKALDAGTIAQHWAVAGK